MCDGIIFGYTADDVKRNGELHNVSDLAKKVGFTWPVWITNGVLALVNPSEETKVHGQSYTDRLRDVLIVAVVAVQITSDKTLVPFHVFFWDSPATQYQKKFYAALNNANGPAIHIMLPDEYQIEEA